KCFPKEKRLVFYKFTSYDELEIVYYNLKEPRPLKTNEMDKDHIDLIIVPGLVYDQEGYRIGFGGGYYDRFLANYANETVSLAGQIQMVTNVPSESFDIPVNHIITENGHIK